MNEIDETLFKEEEFESRAYQDNISNNAHDRSTLVVLPTGMGKTIIAFQVMGKKLAENPDKKILFLAPTKPLVNQHGRDVVDSLEIDDDDVLILTGETRPQKRKELWEDHKIIVSTPQVIKNDLEDRRISLDKVQLTIFDEVHRAAGDYAYVFIGKRYRQKSGHTLGLTASPGSEMDEIIEVCKSIGLEHVEIRTKYDPDVVNYTEKLEKNWEEVELTDIHKKIVDLLNGLKEKYIKKLQDQGFFENKTPSRVSRKKLIEAQEEMQKELHSTNDSSLYYALSVVASATKIDHAAAQAETQGLKIAQEYIKDILNESKTKGGTKASKRIAEEDAIKEVMGLIEQAKTDHPKVGKTKEIVEEQFEKKPDSRVIVFTNYRNTAKKLVKRLAVADDIKPVRFVGQRDKKGDAGLKQREQIETLDKFEEGTYNVLVATSVGEEGLDIPSTDMVVFYEPIPSEVRTIQRRGRTARTRKGKVVLLITKGTRDEAHYWVSKRKEESMHKNLRTLRKELDGKISMGDPIKGIVEPEGEELIENSNSQKTLEEYGSEAD